MTYDKPDYTYTDIVTVSGVSTATITWKPTSNYPGRVDTATFTSRMDATTFAIYAYGVAIV